MSVTDIAKTFKCSPNYIYEIIRNASRMIRKSDNKQIIAYKNDIIDTSYHRGSLSSFRDTGESSVEWAVFKLEDDR